jgi:glutamine amidotransferase
MEITFIDSPVANTANIARALRSAGAELRITADPKEIAAARKLVLPGVGSFKAAMSWLESTGVDTAIHEAVARKTPLLGICVGHQLLFESSEEMGVTRGLGLVRGEVKRIQSTLPVPQIGWNRVDIEEEELFGGIGSGTPFYFVNSYVASGTPAEIARATYGMRFTAAVREGNVFGVQFHPEKSSTAGLQVLRNFVEKIG